MDDSVNNTLEVFESEPVKAATLSLTVAAVLELTLAVALFWVLTVALLTYAVPERLEIVTIFASQRQTKCVAFLI